MNIKIGVLSDTHMIRPTDAFRDQAARCFADVSVILHAGDLTALSVLDVFNDKEMYAVHGNMCHGSSRNSLPRQRVIEIGGFRIGLTHGMGIHSHIEDHLMQLFDDVDCIVSGHTHRPVCHRLYGILFVNPGSFMGSGRYGAPGTYAVMEAGESLICHILDVPQED
ncbi:MAG: metallophosphoesterase family protein [Desulfobulbaceae bacterium]|uniref:Phosphoesterase n=1 Tax=Candidatus Desulfobia pelagia TaxID=2841692 RepID=A0A8J6NCP3_9BACT|nr:metallophosphoesterase family protein [Candidatus Desulfobia pelagia]